MEKALTNITLPLFLMALIMRQLKSTQVSVVHNIFQLKNLSKFLIYLVMLVYWSCRVTLKI